MALLQAQSQTENKSQPSHWLFFLANRLVRSYPADIHSPEVEKEDG